MAAECLSGNFWPPLARPGRSREKQPNRPALGPTCNLIHLRIDQTALGAGRTLRPAYHGIRSYVRLSGFGKTRKIAMISPFTSILLTSVALNPRLSPGLTSLHPLPVFIFCPRGTFDRIFVFVAICLPVLFPNFQFGTTVISVYKNHIRVETFLCFGLNGKKRPEAYRQPEAAGSSLVAAPPASDRSRSSPGRYGEGTGKTPGLRQLL